ncbi:MAG: DUF1772 domain-containing protein [Myxococcales bacterium]|nr:DUF1772 domain-containing protein [Myxococcales bacterium]
MSGRFASMVSVLGVLVLGLTAGAMLAEAAILVPYWQSLAAADFFDWYAANASLLVDFYSPLEIASVLVALVCAVLYSAQSRPGARLWWIAAILSILVIATFFLYFKDANAGFLNRTIADDSLAGALATWGTWQWARVGVGCAAFAAAVLAVRSETSHASSAQP